MQKADHLLTEELGWSTFYLLSFYNLAVLFQTRPNIFWNVLCLQSLLFLFLFLSGNPFWRCNPQFRQLLFYFLVELSFSQACSWDEGVFLLHVVLWRPCGFPGSKAALGKWGTPPAALCTGMSGIQSLWEEIQAQVTLSVVPWGSITWCHKVWVIQAWFYHHLPGC